MYARANDYPQMIKEGSTTTDIGVYMGKTFLSIIILQLIAILLLAFGPQLAGTGPTSENFLANGDLETGTWAGWNVGGACYIDNSTVHSGQFSAYVSDIFYDNWISQYFYPKISLKVDQGLIFNGWVYPLNVSSLGDVQYPFSVIRLFFVNATSGEPALMVSYDWCWNEYENNITTPITFLLEFQANEWNLLSRNVTSDIYSFYGNMDYSDIVLSYVTCLYHYSDVSPGAFYVDDLKLSSSAELPQINNVSMFGTSPPPYVHSNETRTNEPVVVKANVSNAAQVLLKFSKQSEDWFNVSMVYNASEDLWVQTIPGQVNSCTVNFMVEALDMYGFGTSSILYSYDVKGLFAGDINGDGQVDIFDAILLAANYGKT
jgi:hypothetical protein